MPTTVTASDGTTYHLWQLPDLSAPEPEDEHRLTTLDNEMSEGYRSNVLFGLPAGVRSWRWKLPTLAGSTVIAAAVTDPYSATVSREDYVRNVVKYCQTTGNPIAIQWPSGDGNYYLVDVVNPSLTMTKRKGVDIYDTNLELQQRRINGKTVYDVNKLGQRSMKNAGGLKAWLKGANFSGTTWTDSSISGLNGTATGDVVKVSAAQNGHDIVRFSNTTNDGRVNVTNTLIAECFIVMKMRENTFSNNAGILSGNVGSPILVGASGTTKFTNQSVGATYEYRLNGVQYAESNQQAPMNTWGIVHMRETSGGFVVTTTQFGKDRTTAGTFAEVDIGEIVLLSTNLSTFHARELTEYLSVKWDIEI